MKQRSVATMIRLGSTVYAFGINVYTNEIIDNFNVLSIIDDFAQASEYRGFPIISSDQIRKHVPVINCAGGRIGTTQALLKKVASEVIHYAELQMMYPQKLRDLVFNEGFRDIYATERDRFEKIESKLADEVSRATFRNLVEFRRTQKISHLMQFEDRQDCQYFEPFLLRKPDAIFYDVGCFDGKNTEDFIRWNAGNPKVWYFEPFKGNFARCDARLGSFKNVHGVNLALGNVNGNSYIVGQDDTATVASDGGEKIEIIRLDDLELEHLEPPTFIKMDIEGAELQALHGMSRTIKEHKPQLAVSVYHRPRDFFEIPEYILSLVPDYEIYLRHYTESIYESVMFFLPDRK
jgi:FkbM family methyltransferase